MYVCMYVCLVTCENVSKSQIVACSDMQRFWWSRQDSVQFIFEIFTLIGLNPYAMIRDHGFI